MVTQEKIAEFSGETVRNVAGALIWLARPPEPLELRGPIERVKIEKLTDSLRGWYDNVNNFQKAFLESLPKEAENFSLGQEIDPDDIAVPELEKSEEYFRKEREELRGIRDVLQRKGGVESYGAEVFAALERLDELFECLVTSQQELRWTIMIHDGALAPSPRGTCASGSEFMASMEDS